MNYCKTQNLSIRKIESETFILNRNDSLMHALNPTAAFIWECMNLNLTPQEIADRIADTFEVNAETALDDMYTFFTECEKKGLISFVN